MFVYAIGVLAVFVAAETTRRYIAPSRSPRGQHIITLVSLLAAVLLTHVQIQAWQPFIGQGILVIAYAIAILGALFAIHKLTGMVRL